VVGRPCEIWFGQLHTQEDTEQTSASYAVTSGDFGPNGPDLRFLSFAGHVHFRLDLCMLASEASSSGESTL